MLYMLNDFFMQRMNIAWRIFFFSGWLAKIFWSSYVQSSIWGIFYSITMIINRWHIHQWVNDNVAWFMICLPYRWATFNQFSYSPIAICETQSLSLSFNRWQHCRKSFSCFERCALLCLLVCVCLGIHVGHSYCFHTSCCFVWQKLAWIASISHPFDVFHTLNASKVD